MMNKTLFIFLATLLVLVVGVAAEENITEQVNPPVDNSTIEPPADNSTVEPGLNESLPPEVPPVPEEEPDEPIDEKIPEIMSFDMVDFLPKRFNIGDAQFNIKIKNKGNVKLGKLVALVSGKGYATYDVMPIEYLNPGESSYIIVMGSFKTAGEIELTIKVNDDIFVQNVTVVDPYYVDAAQRRKDEAAAAAAKRQLIEVLETQVKELELNYTALETELRVKKENNYDVADISLVDLKSYIRDARSSILMEDPVKAKASIEVAHDELQYQAEKISEAKLIKKSWMDTFRSNLLLISSTAGAILTLFAAYELFKKKKEAVAEKVMNVRVSFAKKKLKIKSPKEKKKQKKKSKPAEGTKEETPAAEEEPATAEEKNEETQA